MEAFVVRGGRKLEGTMRVDGAKNAALPILAASVLTEETVVLQGVPMISDVRKMTDILTMLGCRIRRDGHTLTLDAGGLNRTEMPDALSKQIRSSIFLLGPILSRFRQATVTYPGGCEIGLRPIDLHLSGLRSLGVVIHEEGGVIHCDGGNMPKALLWALGNLLTNCLAKPDFIAYRFSDRDNFCLRWCRWFYHVQEINWTIITKEEMRAAESAGNLVIFQDFDPRL